MRAATGGCGLVHAERCGPPVSATPRQRAAAFGTAAAAAAAAGPAQAGATAGWRPLAGLEAATAACARAVDQAGPSRRRRRSAGIVGGGGAPAAAICCGPGAFRLLPAAPAVRSLR